MDKGQSDGPTENLAVELSDLDVDAIGLVRRAAHGSPFYFIKSREGSMSKEDEKARAAADAGEEETPKTEVEEKDQPKSSPEKQPEPELAADPAPTEDFAQQLAVVKAELAAERAEREALKEKSEEFAGLYHRERTARRLEQFGEKVRGFSFSVEMEQFAEDLLALEDYDDELYGRWMKRLQAIDEQIKSADLFGQATRAGEPTDTGEHPFLNAVEKIRKENYGDKDVAEGFSLAYEDAQAEHPDLARAFAQRGR